MNKVRNNSVFKFHIWISILREMLFLDFRLHNLPMMRFARRALGHGRSQQSVEVEPSKKVHCPGKKDTQKQVPQHLGKLYDFRVNYYNNSYMKYFTKNKEPG